MSSANYRVSILSGLPKLKQRLDKTEPGREEDFRHLTGDCVTREIVPALLDRPALGQKRLLGSAGDNALLTQLTSAFQNLLPGLSLAGLVLPILRDNRTEESA